MDMPRNIFVPYVVRIILHYYSILCKYLVHLIGYHVRDLFIAAQRFTPHNRWRCDGIVHVPQVRKTCFSGSRSEFCPLYVVPRFHEGLFVPISSSFCHFLPNSFPIRCSIADAISGWFLHNASDMTSCLSAKRAVDCL